MVSVYYDLHIHTGLSPCADDDMTPNDIVGMALLNGLDLIAVTDHNSLSNAEAVVKAARRAQDGSGNELIVLPGIEITTAEEVHVLCLFSNIDIARGFESELSRFYSPLKNRAEIFGNQILFDENDEIIGELERMLFAPTSISFDGLFSLTSEFGGAFIPAHVDRDSFSVLSNLGFLPPHLPVNTVEVSKNGLYNGFVKQNAGLFPHRKVVFSSDAHQLWNINEREQFLSLPRLDAKVAVEFLH